MADGRMNVHFYKNKDDKKKVNKLLENPLDYNCTLKDDTSIINPVIIIGGSPSQIIGDSAMQEHPINYCYIPRFDRYYYVTDITILNAYRVEISCHCDVLMSHLKKTISTTPLLASRWEKGQKAQEFVPEERLNLRTKTQLTVHSFGSDIIEMQEKFILCTAGTGERPQP